ncbi:hypothetical protein [Seonamhaeicola maritimus]|uniref:putative polyvalent protein kinase domain-containing protein n=1 Tax=Seonamhaeicola maritimus TaxID=2591822 RepID=UPI00249469AF|nr:hypothetical protein [Seonamhaeicola maritimus]
MTKQEIEDLERVIACNFADANQLWIDDFFSLGNYKLKGGHENTLVLDEEKLIVYKSNNLMNTKYLISNLVEKVFIHNELFPETGYEIIGFTGLKNHGNRTPYIEVVLKQDYIPGLVKSSFEEISVFMESLGFKQITIESYRNDKYVVYDLYPRNVLKDEKGTIFVVDAEFVRL